MFLICMLSISIVLGLIKEFIKNSDNYGKGVRPEWIVMFRALFVGILFEKNFSAVF